MTRGPTIGILLKNLDAKGLAALKPGAMKLAALPNIFAANPPTFAKPLLANPFPACNNFVAPLATFGNNLDASLRPLLIKFLTSLNAFFIFLITPLIIFSYMTLNTIAHTMGAAGVGAEVSRIWGDDSLTVASIILTLAVLFLSEIIPKTIGAAYWKKLSLPSGFILSGMTKMLAPFFVPLLMFKRLLPKAESASVTRDELHALADISEEEGELEEDEETVIHNLLALREMPVKDIMTPRTVTLAFEQGWTIRQVLDDTKILRFGRMPVYEESIDQLSGFVLRSDILMAASMDEWDKVLTEMRKPLMTIGVDDSVDLALETFLKSKVQILAVVDEFGGTAGIVTMEDAIETLLGEEIVDELDEHEDMRELAREQAASEEE